MSEWQPIETAPKDGRWVRLAWEPSDWTTGDGYFANGEWSAFAVFHSLALARQRIKPPYEGRLYRCKPTHWMPLPAAPEQAAAEQTVGEK